MTMKMIERALLGILAVMAMAALSVGSANAQATRTWVSGVGDDANPCSRTAPCKTFAGAISKTAAGGEIDCLDPGGFGVVTIVKSITIDCNGVTGGILNAGANGVIINAGVNDKIVLRNLSIDGAGTGLNGVRFLAGAQLSIDNCTIEGMTGNGIDVAKTAGGDVYVTDCYITKVNIGIRLSTTAGFITAGIENTIIANPTTNGVEISANNGSVATIKNTLISSAGGNGVVTTGGGGVANVDSSTLVHNATALNAGVNGSFINISNNNIYANVTGFAIAAGATIASANNNRTANNGGATLPNGSIQLR